MLSFGLIVLKVSNLAILFMKATILVLTVS